MICVCGKHTTHGVWEGGASNKYCRVECLVDDWNKNNNWKITQEEIMTMEWGNVTGYKPEKNVEVGGFKPLKGNYNCFVNNASVGMYEGDYEDYKGKEFINYELQAANGQGIDGRKLWKRINIEDEAENKKGKTKLQQFMDAMFTLDLEFHNKEELVEVLTKFETMDVKVNTYHFKGDEDKDIQMHKIMGLADGELEKPANTDVPF